MGLDGSYPVRIQPEPVRRQSSILSIQYACSPPSVRMQSAVSPHPVPPRGLDGTGCTNRRPRPVGSSSPLSSTSGRSICDPQETDFLPRTERGNKGVQDSRSPHPRRSRGGYMIQGHPTPRRAEGVGTSNGTVASVPTCSFCTIVDTLLFL